ncbi:MAG TPA: SusD/RagB family nutrient-binding outer membrane lipoprotein [Chitinophagaceae bacterium]|nr:SusD/RagB family nutrient-binding outer membrane lipoprotein [Chitinophagaceae bacterium]
MKKYKFLSASLILLLVISSCEKKIDEAFLNPNASVRVPIETLLPGIIGNFVGSSAAAGSAYGTANDGMQVGRYIQFWATNTSGNQFDQMGGATGASDLMGSVWAMHYYGMGQNLNKMVEWGIEEKKWDYVGVGLAIRAWSWLTLTDMYGEVIVREAFNTSNLTFTYQDQPEVYDSVRAIAHRAIEYLSATGDNVSKENLDKGDHYFYAGDVNKWKKFANTVIALSYHRLTNKADYKADSVIKYGLLGINSVADDATAKFANTGISGTANFYGPLRANVGTMRQTEYIAGLLNGTNTQFAGVTDPRAAYIIRENSKGLYRGIKPNLGTSSLPAEDQPRNFWGGSFGLTASTSDTGGRYIFRNAAPFPILTAAQTKFMLAEAYYRKNQKAQAKQAYVDGINASFDMLTTAYEVNIPAPLKITAASRSAYLANAKVVPPDSEFSLSHIMLQKYIASYGYGTIETWIDMRRYHYNEDKENGNPVYTDFTPPSGVNLFVNNNNRLVYRARPRYNSEYLYNVSELERIGAIALDYHTKEMWFSQK